MGTLGHQQFRQGSQAGAHNAAIQYSPSWRCIIIIFTQCTNIPPTGCPLFIDYPRNPVRKIHLYLL